MNTVTRMVLPGMLITTGSEEPELNTQTTFVELKAPETEAFPQIPTAIHSFIPQLTIEKNGLVIRVNSNTPKELLALALEAVSYV
jgi:hypothetical protein